MIIQKNRRVRTWDKIEYISQLDATEKNIWILQLNIADSKKNLKIICWPAFYYTLLS